MPVIKYFTQKTITGLVLYVTFCSECGDLEECRSEADAEKVCVDHSLEHIMELNM